MASASRRRFSLLLLRRFLGLEESATACPRCGKDSRIRAAPPAGAEQEPDALPPFECPFCHNLMVVRAEQFPARQVAPCASPPTFPARPGGALVFLKCAHCGYGLLASRRSGTYACEGCGRAEPIPAGYVYATNNDRSEHLSLILGGEFNTSICSICGYRNYLQFAFGIRPYRYEVVSSIRGTRERVDFVENGRTYYFLGKYSEAVGAYEQARLSASYAEHDNCRADDLKCYGAALQHVGRDAEIPGVLERALTIRSADGVLLQMLGFAYGNLKEWENAASPFRRIVLENIQVSDMFIDNILFRANALDALIHIERQSGRGKEAAH